MNATPSNLEQRMKFLEDRIAEHFEVCSLTKITTLEGKIEYLTEIVKKIENIVENKYVTKAEFDPVKKLVYGMVGILLTGMITTIMYSVLK